jgi:hypothetical protein
MPGQGDPNAMTSTFGIVSDRAETNKTIKDTEKFRGSVDKSDKSVNELSSSLTNFDKIAENAFDAAAKRAEKLQDEAKKTSDTFDMMAKKTEVAFSKMEQARPSAAGGDGGGSLGGVTSGLSQAGGALLGEGFGGVGKILELAQGATELTEVAGDAKRGITSLGGGIVKTGAAAGVAGIALVALGVVVKSFLDEANEAAEELTTAVDATRQVNEQIAQGLTSEDAQARIEELNRLREEEVKILEPLQDGQEKVNDRLGVFSGIAGKFEPRVKRLNQELEKSEELVEGYDAEIEKLNEALDEGKLSANDAAVAEQERAEEAEKAAEELIREEEKLADKRKGAIDKLANAQEQALKQTANANKKFNQALSDSSAQTSQALSDASKGAAKARKKLTRDFSETMAEDLADGFENVLDIGKDFGKELKQNQIELNRSIRDINRKASDDIQDSLDDRNVLQLLEIQKQRKREIRDEKIANRDETQDAQTARNERLDEERDAQKELKQERLDAFRDQKRDLKEDLSDQRDSINIAASRRRDQLRKARQRELQIIQEGLAEQEKAWKKFVKEFVKAGAALNDAMGSGGSGGSGGRRRSADRDFASSSFLGLNR